jgi:hypothetical protein
MTYFKKYLKYKNKYLSIIQKGGMETVTFEIYGKTIRTDIYSNLTCPITLDIMIDPVIASDGFTYERASIENLLNSANPKSPFTRDNLTKVLIPNNSLKGVIDEFKEKTYQRGLKKQINKLKIKVENGDKNAANELAFMYRDGIDLVIRDLEKAIEYFEIAVKLGDLTAQIHIDKLNCDINEQKHNLSLKKPKVISEPISSDENIVFLYAGLGERNNSYTRNNEHLILPYKEQIDSINIIYKKYMNEDITSKLNNILSWTEATFRPIGMERNFNYLYFICNPLFIKLVFKSLEDGKNFVKEINDKLNYIAEYPIKYGDWEICALHLTNGEYHDYNNEHIYDRDKDGDWVVVNLYGGYYQETQRYGWPDIDEIPSDEELTKIINLYDKYNTYPDEDFKDNLNNFREWERSYHKPDSMTDLNHDLQIFNIEFISTRDAINFVREVNVELNRDNGIETYGDWRICATIQENSYPFYRDYDDDMMNFRKIEKHINDSYRN